jgi:hypothetical protein
MVASEDSGTDPTGSVPTPPSLQPAEVLNRYFAAHQRQQARLRDTSMDVAIEASLPRLKKEGSLRASRQIASSGQITYQGSRSAGDKMVIKEVIARYLSAEADASKGLVDVRGNPQSIAINTENYRFRHKAVLTVGEQRTYIFQVTPRKNRLGLFKGEVWVDAETGMPVRESGRLVKKPSVFLSRVDFIHEYEIRDGLAVPVLVESTIDTRLVGRAELAIRYSNYALPQPAESRICALGW